MIFELIDIIRHSIDLFLHFLQLTSEPFQMLLEMDGPILVLFFGLQFLFYHFIYNLEVDIIS